MYIKFCRIFGEGKKDEAGENLSSKLSVELQEEKGRIKLFVFQPWLSYVLSSWCVLLR